MARDKYDDFVSVLGGCVVSVLISIVSLGTIFGSGIPFRRTLESIIFVIALIWICFLLGSYVKTQRRLLYIISATAVFIVIALYIVYYVWHRGYLTVTPLVSINSIKDGLCYDTLFHSSIAQGIKNYGLPSFLVNSEAFFNYHFGSHLFMALLSKMTQVPLFFVYCYLFPAIFLPLYVYLALSVSKDLRLYLKIFESISIVDLMVIACFIVPIVIPNSVNDTILANWKSSWFVSESHMVALIITLLFFKIVFVMLRRDLFNRKYITSIFQVLVIPVFIVAASLAKISIGFFLCIGIVYYDFRNHIRELGYYFCELLYISCFLAVFLLPNLFKTAFVSNTSFSTISILDHIKTFVSLDLWGIHILNYFFFTIVFLVFRFKDEECFKDIICSRKYILEEILILVSLLGAIPGNLFLIRGGSSFYFSAVQQIVATIMLIGYNIPNQIINSYWKSMKRVAKICVALIVSVACWGGLVQSCFYIGPLYRDYKYGADAQKNVCNDKNGYWSELCSIMDITLGKENQYYIYVDSSATIWNRFSNKDIAMHYYPSMTGVVCIGELYYDSGKMFYNDGTPYESGWYKVNPEDKKMNLEKAIEKTRNDEKKGLILINNDGVTAIEL